ncbi:MAG: hypothetical protein NTV21_18255 [Planctomycetota bacterium]|nr:hypothetical protein [Planctomycetota bacterium]
MPPAANPITTTGLTSTVSTTLASGESVPSWVDRHGKAVSSSTPSGNTLTTNYTSATGTETVITTRKAAETDSELLTRHRAEYLLKMLESAPIP